MAPDTAVLFLVIKEQFAQAILEGRKQYELRLGTVSDRIRYVLLYVTETQEIIGGFTVEQVIRKPKGTLWRLVGERATTKERFDVYFADVDEGTAIEVGRLERYAVPMRLRDIRRILPDFFVPMSYGYLSGDNPMVLQLAAQHPLLRSTARRQQQAKLHTDPAQRIRLCPAAAADKDLFLRETKSIVGADYDEIDDTFGESIWESHERGQDPNGFFTKKKTVHRIEAADDGRLVGFTVTTEKRGGSVKFGPTLLLAAERHRGFAVEARNLLDQDYAGRGFRKGYSTIPAHRPGVLRYLTKAGYRIEAHMRCQYSTDHDELVLGKVLIPTPYRAEGHRLPATHDDITMARGLPTQSELTAFLQEQCQGRYTEIDEAFAASILAAAHVFKQGEYATKGKVLLTARDAAGKLAAVVVCTPKRGGAVKISPFLTKSPAATPRLLLHVEEHLQRTLTPRKVYALLPALDPHLLAAFANAGYEHEGHLVAPYAPGCDFDVLAKQTRAAS